MGTVLRPAVGGAALLAVLFLTGCGGSPQAAAKPTAVVAVRPVVHRPAPPDASVQAALGQILAARTLEQNALNSLSDAAEAESEQLPDTVNADLGDASRSVSGAERLFATLAAPAAYNSAVFDLRMAGMALDLACTNRIVQGRQVNEATRDLSRANADLAGRTYASLPGVQRSLREALVRAALVRGTASGAHVSTHTVLATRRPHRRLSRRASPTATAAPTPKPTVAFVVRVTGRKRIARHRVRLVQRHRTRQHEPSRVSRHRSVHVDVPPTATATATAVPTTVPTPSPTAIPPSVAALARYLPRLQVAHAEIDLAWRELTRCSSYVDELRTGEDVGGSARIHACLTRGAAAMLAVSRELRPLVHGVADRAVAGRFAALIGANPSVQQALTAAGQKVDAVDLDGAYAQLRAARIQVAQARKLVAEAAERRPL